MAVVIEKPPLWRRVAPVFQGYDGPFLLAVLLLAGIGLGVMYSVGHDVDGRFLAHARNMAIAAGVMFVAAQVPPQRLLALAVPVYAVGVALLVAASGLFVIFFAGLSWKLILPPVALGVVGIVTLIAMEPQWCQPDVDWVVLHEYQRQRVCTLLDPMKDPLGKGFMQGTQTHLDFVPERTTDFIFASYAEEFGFVGVLVLLAAFLFLIYRGLKIATEAPTLFARLLAGALTLIYFVYAFVNMGMVSGILPVVGVPLPFISYGGTAMVTLGASLGMILSISKSKRLVQS